MDEEIDLLDYWRVLVKWKKSIATIVLVIAFFSVVVSLVLPKGYRAEVTIIPVGGQTIGGLGGAMAKLGLGGLLGSALPASSSMPLLILLKSRTFTERIIKKYDLIEMLYKPDGSEKAVAIEDAVDTLLSAISFETNSDNQLITIRAEANDPNLAAYLANTYVKELGNYVGENALTVAKRNRFFVEEQLERNKAELLESGKELSTFYATNKVSNVVPTVDVNVAVENREIQAESSRLKAEGGESQRDWFPAVPSAAAEIRKRTGEVQKQADEFGEKIGRAKIIKDVPQQVYLQYLTLRRELLGQVNSLLTQQYEMAKIEENREEPSFHVIDPARVPKMRFKPRRRAIVSLSFMTSLFVGVFYAFVREYLEKFSSKQIPANP